MLGDGLLLVHSADVELISRNHWAIWTLCEISDPDVKQAYSWVWGKGSQLFTTTNKEISMCKRLREASQELMKYEWSVSPFHIPDLVESLLVSMYDRHVFREVWLSLSLLLCFYRLVLLKLRDEDETSIISYAFHRMYFCVSSSNADDWSILPLWSIGSPSKPWKQTKSRRAAGFQWPDVHTKYTTSYKQRDTSYTDWTCQTSQLSRCLFHT